MEVIHKIVQQGTLLPFHQPLISSFNRELAFFLPKFVAPWVPGTEPPIQRTLAIIRPGALQGHKDEIVEKISEAGFQIAFQKELQLSKEQAEEFYKEHEGKDYYDSLTTHMARYTYTILFIEGLYIHHYAIYRTARCMYIYFLTSQKL